MKSSLKESYFRFGGKKFYKRSKNKNNKTLLKLSDAMVKEKKFAIMRKYLPWYVEYSTKHCTADACNLHFQSQSIRSVEDEARNVATIDGQKVTVNAGQGMTEWLGRRSGSIGMNVIMDRIDGRGDHKWHVAGMGPTRIIQTILFLSSYDGCWLLIALVHAFPCPA